MSADANNSQEGGRLSKIRKALGLSVDDSSESEPSQTDEESQRDQALSDDGEENGLAEDVLEETDEDLDLDTDELVEMGEGSAVESIEDDGQEDDSAEEQMSNDERI